jgi:hypothetical protein
MEGCHAPQEVASGHPATSPSTSAMPPGADRLSAVGCCFNCLRSDHIAVDWTYNSHCLCCHHEGALCLRLQVCLIARLHSPPPPRQHKPPPVVVLNLTASGVMLVTPAPRHTTVAIGPSRSRRHAPEGSTMPPWASAGSTLEGSPSHHPLPSPPPPPLPP